MCCSSCDESAPSRCQIRRAARQLARAERRLARVQARTGVQAQVEDDKVEGEKDIGKVIEWKPGSEAEMKPETMSLLSVRPPSYRSTISTLTATSSAASSLTSSTPTYTPISDPAFGIVPTPALVPARRCASRCDARLQARSSSAQRRVEKRENRKALFQQIAYKLGWSNGI